MQEDAPFGTHRRTKTGYGNSTTPPLEKISGSSVSDDPCDRRFLLTVVSVAAAEVARPALMALSVRRGPIRERYGAWDSVINS